MKRLTVLLACAVLAFATAAQAKGPSGATIEGPGLDEPIRLSGDSESNNATASPFYRFVQEVGFFPAVFCCQQPNPMLSTRPKGALGPKYRIVYVVPGPENKSYRVMRTCIPTQAEGRSSTRCPVRGSSERCRRLAAGSGRSGRSTRG
jgi:hypothetical protein